MGAVYVPSALTAEQAASVGDCTEIDLHFETNTEPLTDAEIAQQHARRQADSLNQFERCVTAQNRSGGGGSGGGGNGGGNGAGLGGGTGVAAAGISGTEAPPVDVQENAETQAPADALATQTIEPTLNNGRAPLDIPPADSDGALAAQVRLAAESETDPERQARLWNEYRKIRGLPTQ